MTEPGREQRGRKWISGAIARKGVRPRFAAYLIIAFWAVAVVVFGVIERLIDPNTFDNIWIAMWWALQTVTTVGYGDVVPQQTAGKVIGAFLMLGGLSLLTILTAAVTSGFIAQAQQERRGAEQDEVAGQLREINAQLAEIQRGQAR